MRRRWKRISGRYIPKYTKPLPWKLREELDIHEERVMYDEWDNYRDGFREPLEKNKIKFKISRNKFIPKHFFKC